MQNLKNKLMYITNQKQTHGYSKQTNGYQWREGREEMQEGRHMGIYVYV